jgi:hypothetical protein
MQVHTFRIRTFRSSVLCTHSSATDSYRHKDVNKLKTLPPRSRTHYKTNKRLTKHDSVLTLRTSCITTPCLPALPSSGARRNALWYKRTDISQQSAASIFKTVHSEYLAHRPTRLNTCQETRVKICCFLLEYGC